jgi:hypothetical protein
VQIERLHPAEAHDGQENARENMEAHGQSCQTLSTEQDEPQKQPALHSRHPTRHLPATASDLFKIRGPDARPPRKRALQHFHQQSHAKVQASHQIVQGRKDADV